MRMDERKADELRPISIEINYLHHPEGSVLISIGNTKVICTASLEDRVPPFLRGQGKGWITAEYSMLPRATEQRNMRESTRGKVSGRTMEIQRLIGRALRSIIDLDKIGERTVWIDCDVIQADGGTRTTSITGAFVALSLAMEKALANGAIQEWPIDDFLAAVSVGIDPKLGAILDLCYAEDAQAEVDMNVVMTGKGEYVELQGTGEEATFSHNQLLTILALADKGIKQLIEAQRNALGAIANRVDEAKQKKKEQSEA
ncbi:ribonuclease PH [Halalkalibacterium halodurans]|uniref:ribonuclease PH n=1 Tax=Halalkalibacterium halodurans TaxID=86665 RepID=UPI001067CA29|nr:ribonuclease PH [Halalkalibacterium halodurans]MED3645911.1 ribonuclease PH [Halalkalibacterium halodurans]MED4125552.1 ribonuclease PH [Halalkalibacterium halodurans]TES58135.1 ribonuclease PH [Halalkalibacterium halodurans]